MTMIYTLYKSYYMFQILNLKNPEIRMLIQSQFQVETTWLKEIKDPL